ncbi:hypothetical protein BMWSH_2479 [Priestia megaterium WSH-002]|uniref:Uncharacterized protein n=1 Tax=Priestia megaterium (strain WSH-002) TaxID=1006007 RepID=A0A8D4BKC7_PRIMW|nr:hypothetical protein [Priestia megaterium]AEN89361.1 hypothetical protein BMWSH_2479 [Priestia megaterium WSH-002]
MKEVNVRESSQEREQRIQQQWQQGNVFQQSVQKPRRASFVCIL